MQKFSYLKTTLFFKGIEFLAEVFRHIVEDVLATVGREHLGAFHHAVPLLFCEPTLYVGAAYVVAKHGVDKTGVEVVASTNGAHRLGLGSGILLAHVPIAEHHGGVLAIGVDEALTIERDLGVVSLVGIVDLIDHVKVVSAAAHDVGKLEVLNEVWGGPHDIATM